MLWPAVRQKPQCCIETAEPIELVSGREVVLGVSNSLWVLTKKWGHSFLEPWPPLATTCQPSQVLSIQLKRHKFTAVIAHLVRTRFVVDSQWRCCRTCWTTNTSQIMQWIHNRSKQWSFNLGASIFVCPRRVAQFVRDSCDAFVLVARAT